MASQNNKQMEIQHAQIEEKKESTNDNRTTYENIFDTAFNTKYINWNELYHLAIRKGRILYVANMIKKHYSSYLEHYYDYNSLPPIPNLSNNILKFMKNILKETEIVNNAHNLLHSHSDWETQVDDVDNISVFYRPYNENGIHAIKCLYTSKCNPLNLISVINEFDLMKEIITIIPMETKYLKEFTDLNKVIYNKINLWWPFYARDCVAHVRAYDLLNEYGEILVWGKSFDKLDGVEIPLQDTKTVRVEVVMGKGVIKPKLDANNELITQVICTFCIDSKSMLPKILINWISRTFAYYTCKMIRDTTENLKDTQHFQRMKEKDIYKQWQNELDIWKQKQMLRKAKK